MRGKRSKQYRKLMHQYGLTFNFREPYQVLIDSEIIRDAARFKMRLGAMLEGTLHGLIKPMITQCCIRHLYSAPECPEKAGWIEVAKQAERRRCNHHELEEPLSEQECVLSVLDPKSSKTNRHRYVVASQNAELRAELRRIPGVPLVYISRSVMILEPMARATEIVKEKEEKGKIRAGLKSSREAERGTEATKRKREEDEDDAGDTFEEGLQQVKKKKVKGPKGPNPLSVKKTKKEKPTAVTQQMEMERAVLRRANKSDPQAAEKALDPSAVLEEDGLDEEGERRKRKRKRKPAASIAAVDLAMEEMPQEIEV